MSAAEVSQQDTALVWDPVCAITESHTQRMPVQHERSGQLEMGRGALWQCVTVIEPLRVPHSPPSPCLPLTVGSYGSL